MPELPEVEVVCGLMRNALAGKRMSDVEIVEDPIVLSGHKAAEVAKVLQGRIVTAVGRKGKFWWLELDSGKSMCGHLGMAGWIRDLGKPGGRLMEHGDRPLDDAQGRPKFLKMLLTAEDGSRIAFTDGRRLGRLWLSDDPKSDKRIAKLGPDALNDLPSEKELGTLFARRSGPIKAALLDQGLMSGIGNYLADEILYHAGISPKRPTNKLKQREVAALRKATLDVLKTAIDADADFERFPKEWLFHHRWGGKRGKTEIDGQKLVRETIGGRTTAWVPTKQK